jgi:hypothetical protein
MGIPNKLSMLRNQEVENEQPRDRTKIMEFV